MPEPGLGWYKRDEGGGDPLTRQLSFELAPDIRVNAVAPGSSRPTWHGCSGKETKDESASTFPFDELGNPTTSRRPCSFSRLTQLRGSPGKRSSSTAGRRPSPQEAWSPESEVRSRRRIFPEGVRGSALVMTSSFGAAQGGAPIERIQRVGASDGGCEGSAGLPRPPPVRPIRDRDASRSLLRQCLVLR